MIHGFNSSMVQLKGRPHLLKERPDRRFNSSMVQLKDGTEPYPLRSSRFQFQYGAAESVKPAKGYWEILSFNSSMVQLKERGMKRHRSCWTVSIPVWCSWKRFWMSSEILCYRFNSSMVQLKVHCPRRISREDYVSIPVWCSWKIVASSSIPYRPKFQFQYDAAERPPCRLSQRGNYTFQFQYGAAERIVRKLRVTGFVVSIPVWCSWKHHSGPQVHECHCFNSSMVQLKDEQKEQLKDLQKFQFQYGAAERADRSEAYVFDNPFQFQYGAAERKIRSDMV